MSADTDTDAEGDDHTVDYDLDLELDKDKDDKHVAFNVNNEASGIFKTIFLGAGEIPTARLSKG